MYLKITFRDKTREPLIVCEAEIDTGQLFWRGSEDDCWIKEDYIHKGQVPIESIHEIIPYESSEDGY